ncbi:MAG: hypothetical protein IPH62_19475 [Ignavibacteriae bacterium]|nr:hypothetical protein [Ignavibacteriota bacterium]
MNKNIFYEIFGLTNPGNFQNHSVVEPANPYTNPYAISSNTNRDIEVNNLNMYGKCINLDSELNCKIGCRSLNVDKNQLCPIASNPIVMNGTVTYSWNSCGCYSESILGNKNPTRVDPYDFNKSTSSLHRVPLTSWQHDIYEIFKNRNKNTIISIPPGGGKTRPIKAYFFEKLVKFLADPDNNELPTIFYIVPTRQLAGQIKFNDFIRDSEYGILAALSDLQSNVNNSLTETRTAKSVFENALNNTEMTPFEKEKFILSFAEECVTSSVDQSGIKHEFSPKTISILPFLKNKMVPVIICVKDPTLINTNVRVIKNKFEHVIIDEVQELIPKPESDSSSNKTLSTDSRKLFESLCKIIKEIGHSSTKIHLLTGSVNDESLTILNDNFKSILKVEFEFVPNINRVHPNTGEKIGLPTDGTSNRSKITVIPLQSLSSPEISNAVKAREDLIKNIVRSRQSNSIMIVFSTKQFAKQSLISMLKNVVKDLPKHPQSNFYDNEIKKNVPFIQVRNEYIKSADVNYASDIERIANRETNKTIISKDYYNSSNLTPKELNKHKNNKLKLPSPFQNKMGEYVDEIEFLKYFNLGELNKRDYNLQQDPDEITDIKDDNNLLYQGVLSGIGIMMGAMHQQHKDTIQKLFAKRKIYLLISTDALGIGANVDCKHLYIPTINKFDDGGFGPLNQSSLTQIINRVGRGKFQNGFVYCRQEDADTVEKLIKAKHEVAWKVIGKVPFLDELLRIMKTC